MADILHEAELILMAANLERKCKNCVFCLETPTGRHVCSLGANEYGEPCGDGSYIVGELVDPSNECKYPESKDYISFTPRETDE